MPREQEFLDLDCKMNMVKKKFPDATYATAVLRGGRLTKWKGQAASLSPSLGQLIASVSVFGLVALTFRPLNSFMRPFVQKPKGFYHRAMSGDGAGYKSH